MKTFNRLIIDKLLQWKNSPEHKPLILMGARQIGKTWVMKQFGRQHFEYVVYFNFETHPELTEEFKKTKDPKRIINFLSLHTDQPIEPGRTLIIFDEVQQCNEALNSLKYFFEEEPEYYIIAAGSLLGVSLLRGEPFPVGKVTFRDMYPLTFREFLQVDNPKLFNFFENLGSIEPLPEIVFNQTLESFRRYQICGGMPEVAMAMIKNQPNSKIDELQKDVLAAYSLDFSKHISPFDINRVAEIFRSIPVQLSRENRKFIYRNIRPGARARQYENALLWLVRTRLVSRVFCCTKIALPISNYEESSAFKVYLCDGGLLRAMANLPADVIWNENPIYTEFKGAVAENYILQSLNAANHNVQYYWASEGTAEVDFILPHKLGYIPVEVKAGTRITGKSLSVYIARFNPDFAIRFSLNNLKRDDKILNIPLFLSDWTTKLLDLSE